jgi:hypothetical protein
VNRTSEIRVGVSACLLGEQVRFDGGHKRNSFVTETLQKYVSFVPVCPQVDIGLDTPRETIHLVRSIGGVRLKGTQTGSDHTEIMRRYTNVLQHRAGYFKGLLGSEEKKELVGVIEDYRRGLVPLIVPLTLARHYVRVHKVGYLEGQVYLEPRPKELMLRNHV